MRVTGFGERDSGRNRPVFGFDPGNGLTRLAGKMRTADKQFVAQARHCSDTILNLAADTEIRSASGRRESGAKKKPPIYENSLSTLSRFVQPSEQNRNGDGNAKQ